MSSTKILANISIGTPRRDKAEGIVTIATDSKERMNIFVLDLLKNRNFPLEPLIHFNFVHGSQMNRLTVKDRVSPFAWYSAVGRTNFTATWARVNKRTTNCTYLTGSRFSSLRSTVWFTFAAPLRLTRSLLNSRSSRPVRSTRDSAANVAVRRQC